MNNNNILNNIEAYYNYIMPQLETEDDFVQVDILLRGKDSNNNIGKNMKMVKQFTFSKEMTLEDFSRKVLKWGNQTGARVMGRISPSSKKQTLALMSQEINSMMVRFALESGGVSIQKMEGLFQSAAGKSLSNSGLKKCFFHDFDEGNIGEYVKLLEEYNVEIHYIQPSVSGWHIITSPFRKDIGEIPDYISSSEDRDISIKSNGKQKPKVMIYQNRNVQYGA